LSNLREKIGGILLLIDFELRKMARRKLLHAGLAVSLMLTFLAAAGIYHKTSRHPGKKVASRLVTELINGVTFSETVLLPGIYMILPMVLAIFAAASFAGEFQKGHLRAVAMRPISRWQIFAGYSLMSLAAMFMMFSAIFKRPSVATVYAQRNHCCD
jgi:ABC-type transport system involved in multi-copper enzyme maturation permease subunit